MTRPLRINLAGGWYHVTARGNERRVIYRDDEDRDHFLNLVAEMVELFQVHVHTYVLMPNHYHLLLELPEGNLSGGLQWLNVSYSQGFNRRHRRSGHLFQGRFKSILIDPARWALELSRYLHLNPIRVKRQGLGKRRREQNRRGVGPGVTDDVLASRLEELRAYEWSSYRAYIGWERVPGWLTCGVVLGMMGGEKRARREAYREYVEAGVGEGGLGKPWGQLKGGVVLGDEGFVGQIQEVLEGDEQEQTGLRVLRRRPGIEAICQVVEKIKGERWERFRDRHGDWGRDLVLYLGRKRGGLKLRELGELAGKIDYRSVGAAVQRFEQRCHRDPGLARLLARAEKVLKNAEM